jgi:hypothetical protein
VQLVHDGLVGAATAQDDASRWAVRWDDIRHNPVKVAEYEGRYMKVEQVHSLLLSSWVAARGSGGQELVGAVVAAVTAARQKQGHCG